MVAHNREGSGTVIAAQRFFGKQGAVYKHEKRSTRKREEGNGMKKRTLALAMAAIMGLTTACSGGGQTQQNAAAPAKETEKTGGVAAGGESGEAVTGS